VRKITEADVRAELAKYLGATHPTIPAGRGFTGPELCEKTNMDESGVRRRLQKQLKAGKIRVIGRRPGKSSLVYEAI
jgi:hypothetical protein